MHHDVDDINTSYYPYFMRTTVNLDEDVFQAAQNLAQLKGISLGKALSEMARPKFYPTQSPSDDYPFHMVELALADPLALSKAVREFKEEG
ncbi:MAG: hypothetical protein V4507_08845 [Verrucomicrobiota bacterium]